MGKGMRLIDADAFLELQKRRCWGEPIVGTCTQDNVYLRYELAKAPTIEARPVVRGEWLLNKDGSGTCNRCRRTQKGVWDHDGWQNFCGHCGAEMRAREVTE